MSKEPEAAAPFVSGRPLFLCRLWFLRATQQYKSTESTGKLFVYVRPEYSHDRDDVELTYHEVYGYSSDQW